MTVAMIIDSLIKYRVFILKFQLRRRFFDVKNDPREEEEVEERVREKLAFPTPGFQSCYISDEDENVDEV